jgi:hypothetical protein
MANGNGNGEGGGEGHRGPWRGWHVFARFLPMVVLGLIFLLYGASPLAPHSDGLKFGLLFIYLGAILLVAAFLGMLFTKCPDCYRTNWVICLQEPDVVRIRDGGEGDRYARELGPAEEEA